MTITDQPLPHYPTRTPVRIADLELILGALEMATGLSTEEAAAAARLREDLTMAVQIQANARAGHPSLIDGDDLARLDAANVTALPVAVHRGGHVTEAHAAQSLELKVGSLRTRVLAELAAAGASGLTDLEVEANLGLRRPTGGNRRGELVKLGLVTACIWPAGTPIHAGTTRTRIIAGRSRPATVWVATERGIDALAELGYLARRVVVEPLAEAAAD